MADTALYPPGPPGVPPDLTAPPRSYQARALLVLVCLGVFLAIYLALTVGSAYLCYRCFAALGADDDPRPAPAPVRNVGRTPAYRTPQYQPRRERVSPIWLIAGGVGSGALFLFMVKGLFKRSRSDPGVRVEVTEKEHPELFAFIRQLCRDTRAPFPHRVYLEPHVNAAVSYHESVLNLVVPTRKNLIVGLGLVNRLNLTEFKAVLAHEFGHFSQRSMALGNYVYTANRVIADVVYGRDAFDDALAALGRIDIRISVFVWAFAGGLWVVRKGLAGLFRGINFARNALSRQMEYNADLVAVSVTGSDPLVFALARLDFASESLDQAWADLSAAADHGRFTCDLYFHQTRAADHLRLVRNDPALGTVPPLPDDPAETVAVFKPEDVSVPKMWATHPANHDREANAKRRYVRGPVDERSPWELFADPAAVRERVTRAVYQAARGTVPEALEDPAAVQTFIDAEHAETTYHPQYHGFYDNRYIRPGELSELCARPTWEDLDDPERLAAAHATLWDGIGERMAAHKGRQEEANRLARMAFGAVELTGKDFAHRGVRYRLADAGSLLKKVEAELERDFEWMHVLDRAVFRVHYAMAAQLGGEDRAALRARYEFHFAVQDIRGAVNAHLNHVRTTLNGLSGRREVPQHEFQNALAVCREAHDVLRVHLAAANDLRFPALTNVTAGDRVGPYLLSRPLVRSLPAGATTLDGAWINELLGQMGEVLDKSARVLFKSLGGLLALQDSVAARWVAAHQPGGPEPAGPSAP